MDTGLWLCTTFFFKGFTILWFLSQWQIKTNFVALASRSTGSAGVQARRGMRDEVCVRGTLYALAGARVNVVPGGTRHTRRAGGLGAEGTSPAAGGHPIDRVTHWDGVDSHHVVDVPAYLRERNEYRTMLHMEFLNFFPETLTKTPTYEWMAT